MDPLLGSPAERRRLHRPDTAFGEHATDRARLVTFAVPGSDGDTRPGRRRGSFTWFDFRHDQLLQETGKLSGDVVTGTLTGAALPDATVTELRHLA